MKLPAKVQDITSFLVMDILEKAQQMEAKGLDIVHLEIGEPDFETPSCIRRAACAALDKGQTHYTHSLGLPELRQAISQDYKKRYKVEISPEQILVTQGTSPAMLLLFSCLLEQGDKVVISDPAYACYPNFIRYMGAEVVRVKVTEEDAFQYRPSMIERVLDEHCRAILINSPANPTGTLLSSKRMQAVAELAKDKGLWLVSDEIYHGLVYEGQEHSILEFTDQAFILNGFSKLYAMTGWRLGYVIAPKQFMDPMRKLAQNFFISANAPAQWAGIAALQEAEQDVQKMKKIFNERRQYMIKRLRDMGFSLPHEPTGAFYVLVNAAHLAGRFGGSSLQLAFDILEKAKVGVTPGIDFGPGAEGYLRFSYANSLSRIKEGMDRMEQYLDHYQQLKTD